MASVEDAIQYALAQVGKPYVWGTEGPDTFDCSGLVYAAFRHAGFKVSRVTYTQIRDGRAVSRNDIARGDLWFTDPGHVAIYLGDGRMVESPNPQSRVRVVPVRSFYAARRIGQPSTGGGSGGVSGSPVDLLPDFPDLGKLRDRIENPVNWLRVFIIVIGVLAVMFMAWRILRS